MIADNSSHTPLLAIHYTVCLCPVLVKIPHRLRGINPVGGFNKVIFTCSQITCAVWQKQDSLCVSAAVSMKSVSFGSICVWLCVCVRVCRCRWLCLSLQVLSPTYKQRNEDFRKLFKQLPDTERLIVGEWMPQTHWGHLRSGREQLTYY